MNEIFLMLNPDPGYLPYVLPFLKTIAIISAIFVIITKNPVISLLYLILVFMSISYYLIVIGMFFIGLSYILVYIGAVSILFIFILMLIDVRGSELSTNTNKTIALVLLISLGFFYPMSLVIPQDIIDNLENYVIEFHDIVFYSLNDKNKIANHDEYVNIVNSSNWDNFLIDNTDITSIGNIIYTNDSILLLITSLILLLAMVGSIVITMKKKS